MSTSSTSASRPIFPKVRHISATMGMNHFVLTSAKKKLESFSTSEMARVDEAAAAHPFRNHIHRSLL